MRIKLIKVNMKIALDVSDVVAEAPAPGPGSGGDSFFPLSKKHVIIHNVVKNRQTLNVHCKSADDDLGLIHIPWNHYWGFRFRVNIWSTTMFRCHFTWYGGGSHLFVIFDPWRDDDEFAKYPACDKCLWQVRRQDGDEAICRIGARALEVSDAVADAPGPGSGGDGFIPLAKKHVVIRNVVQNRQTHECTLQI
uniref:S-protein homolog n=1 Tax=Brassica campestris TaxID=3711 RepID=M4CG85_BRACM